MLNFCAIMYIEFLKTNMKKPVQGCDCGSGCDCKPKRSLSEGGMLFLGGFLVATVLIVATSNIASQKDLSANLDANNMSSRSHPVGEYPYQQPPAHYGAPTGKKCSPIGVIVDGQYQETDCPGEELKNEVEEYQDLDDVEGMEADLDDLDAAEAEYIEKLKNIDPNSNDYWEIRNKIMELKAQKDKIRHKKRALQSDMKEKKLQKIDQKAARDPSSDNKQIIEKCRQLGKTDFPACMREHMGKQEQRNEFGDTQSFEFRAEQQGAFSNQGDGIMRPNSIENGQFQNNRPPLTIKDIVKKCIEENPSVLTQCIREGVLDIKEQILREARQKTQQIEEEYSNYETETSNTDNEFEQAGLPPPPKRFVVPSPTPYGNDMPQTEAEWQKYNQQFNRKSTI